jgi:hypothetical protein
MPVGIWTVYRLPTLARAMVLLTAIEIMIKTALFARVVDARLYMAMSRVDGLFVLEYPLED